LSFLKELQELFNVSLEIVNVATNEEEAEGQAALYET